MSPLRITLNEKPFALLGSDGQGCLMPQFDMVIYWHGDDIGIAEIVRNGGCRPVEFNLTNLRDKISYTIEAAWPPKVNEQITSGILTVGLERE